MTKAEITKMIENQKKAQGKAVEMLNAMIKLPSVGADATLIASLIGIVNATIFDTMTTLALILCEMLTEEPKAAPEKAPEPKKGDHDINCSVCNCLCNTCIRDNSHDVTDRACCDKHGFRVCHVTECPDYVKEG